MSIKPTLQVRLSQHLALTPQLQQSIRLLQLSTLELHQEVGQMLEVNPFLDLEEDSALSAYETPLERQAADSAPEKDAADTPDAADAGDELRADEFGTTERADWENGTESDDFDGIRETPASAGSGDGDAADAHDRNGASLSLQEHLRSQIVGRRMQAEDRAALEVLFESLDGDGYLADSLEDIANRLAEQMAIDDPEVRERLDERLQCALSWLQGMDPSGVGARSLGECLTIQIKARAEPSPARQVALRICEHYLELLARRDMKRLTALTGADEDLIREAQELIVACDPKPARPFSDAEGQVIVPDVIVRRSGRGLVVTLNPDVMPKLRINDVYAQASKGLRGAAANPAMSSHLQEARWFVKNVQQRFDTILRVSKAIVERQKSFFSHGDIAMKPLVLREIAEELELHESTISRVTTAKYMTTPQGTFELKYFFGSSLSTEAGGSASSTAVRALIQQFVEAESASKPLSDSQLSAMLGEQGIHVARRTVAKYRDALQIAPAGLRKAL